MTDPMDETAYRETHGGLHPPPRERDDLYAALDDDEDLARLVVRATPFPGLMLATGVLWIIAGAAYVGLFALMRLLQIPLETSGIWLVLGAFFFIKDGIQLLRGKFRDPQADGVISVLIGVVFIGLGFVQSDRNGIIGIFVDGFFGALFLIPGILVLLGRKQYLAWKAEH